MLFNSLQFIFLFLPITALIYFKLGNLNKSFFQMLWLSGMSFLFYAYWNKIYLILLLSSVCVNYAIAQHLLSEKDKPILIFGIMFNILVLAYFKYSGFIFKNLAFISGVKISFHEIILPLGISFITFQKIAYLVDVYRGRVKENSFIRFLTFISFFPQLIAGPIVHYNQIMPQFKNTYPKQFRVINFNIGITFFIIGLAKKVILADTAAQFSDPVFSILSQRGHPTFQECWVAMFSYSFQIYFDFSGYSDMAIGLAKIFGIQLPLNFNSPYKALNIIDFWRRWHMTLSFFLRDYVYIPLGGNRDGERRKHYNLMLTMLLGGLWHGANWTFVLWGGLHGLMLIINHLWRELRTKFNWNFSSPIYKPVTIVMTFLAVTLVWTLFRAPTLKVARHAFKGLSGFYGFGIPDTSYLHTTPIINLWEAMGGVIQKDLTPLLTLLYLFSMFCLIWFLPNTQELVRRMRIDGFKLFAFLQWRPGFAHFVGINTVFFISIVFMCAFEVKPFEYFAF